MRSRKPATLLILLAAALVAAVWAWNHGAPRIEMGPYAALGEVAGDETTKLLGQRSAVVLVVDDTKDARDPVLETQIAAFRAALRKGGSVSIRSIETVKLNPMARMASGGAMPREQLMALATQRPAPDALILFVACPPLDASDVTQLRDAKTRLIVVSAHVPGYRELLRSGVVSLAILPKSVSADDTTGPSPKTAREWFDREYRIVTSAQAAKLAY